MCFAGLLVTLAEKKRARKWVGVPEGGKGSQSWGIAGLPLWGGDLGDTTLPKHHSFTGEEFYPSGCLFFPLGQSKYFVPEFPSTPYLRGLSGSSHSAPNSPPASTEEGREAPPAPSQQDLNNQVRASLVKVFDN